MDGGSKRRAFAHVVSATGAKAHIRPRDDQFEGRRVQKGRICTRESDVVCKRGGFAHVVWGVPWGIAGLRCFAFDLCHAEGR